MSSRKPYVPGPPRGARVEREGEHWTLVVQRELRHPPEAVWRALTDPAQLREWAPFDADADLGQAGRTVNLATVGTPQPMVSQTTVLRADAPRLLEYHWGDGLLRWQLEADGGGGTRLTLWHGIPRSHVAMGAAGWHVCLDVLDHALAGDPLGRTVGPAVMRLQGWQALHAGYARQFGLGLSA